MHVFRCKDASVVERDQPMTASETRGIFYQFPQHVSQPDLCPENDKTVTVDTYIMYLPASGSCYWPLRTVATPHWNINLLFLKMVIQQYGHYIKEHYEMRIILSIGFNQKFLYIYDGNFMRQAQHSDFLIHLYLSYVLT